MVPGMDAPFHVILHQPEIPPNTGNIMRLCAATGTVLHLIGPLGFRLDAAAVRRAGMDYRQWAEVRRWHDWPHYWREHPPQARLFPVSTRGGIPYTDAPFHPGDRLLFGSEGAGLPPELLAAHRERVLRIPMHPGSRSLNLANAVAVVLYAALARSGFSGLA